MLEFFWWSCIYFYNKLSYFQQVLIKALCEGFNFHFKNSFLAYFSSQWSKAPELCLSSNKKEFLFSKCEIVAVALPDRSFHHKSIRYGPPWTYSSPDFQMWQWHPTGFSSSQHQLPPLTSSLSPPSFNSTSVPFALLN